MNSHSRHLADHPLPRLRQRMADAGLPAYRADQVAAWLYGRGVDDPEQMTDLPASLRQALSRDWSLHALDLEDHRTSRDGTQKGLLRCEDGALVEAVAIPEAERTTLCVSTQVGCPLACSFCATGALGFTRNLRTAEIVDQVLHMRAHLPEGRSVTNVVFMGMGEPLLNLSAVVEAVQLLLEPRAFGLPPRRVTVSTAGVVPRLRELVEAVPVHLAVSLHATTDEVRDELVPINRRFPLAVLFEALRSLPRLSRRRPIFFEYTLMAGVNDGVEDARRLVSWVHGLPSKINVIPMNSHVDAPYRAPDAATIDAFLGVLSRAGLTTTLRRSRGADIDAACGQLAARRAGPGPVAPTGRSSGATLAPKSHRGPAGASIHALRDR